MKISKIFTGLVASLVAASVFAVPVVLDITFDDFPNETSFGIWENQADVGDIFAGVPYDVGASSPIGFGDGFVAAGDFTGEGPGPWQFVWDLTEGQTYYFAIFDSFGDGICCDFGSGEYSLTVDGVEVFAGGEFFDIDPVSDTGEYVGGFTASSAATVAEPSTLALLGLGMIGLAVARRRA